MGQRERLAAVRHFDPAYVSSGSTSNLSFRPLMSAPVSSGQLRIYGRIGLTPGSTPQQSATLAPTYLVSDGFDGTLLKQRQPQFCRVLARQLSSMSTTPVHPAGIKPPEQPLPLFRLLRTVADNPVKAWPRALYRERLYRSCVLGRESVYVMAPDLIRTVLVDDADNFEKGELARRALGAALGDAILIADGSRWRWQRRAVAGIFREQRIREFLPAMIASAERTRDRWCG